MFIEWSSKFHMTFVPITVGPLVTYDLKLGSMADIEVQDKQWIIKELMRSPSK